MTSHDHQLRHDARHLLVWLSALVLTLGLSSSPLLWAQERGLTTTERSVPGNERRTALVIGNGAYENGPLRNPVNDARAMATTLRAVGFKVQALENATLTDMKQAIDDFGDALRSEGGVGLFYFSGHGMQVKGRNFIMPLGVRIKGERDIEYEAVDVGRVLGKMEDAGNSLNMVILDACRDNPFARSMRSGSVGLASLDAASGTLIAYATAPGRTADDGTGSNGLYTEQLIRQLKAPGLKVEEVFKRVRVEVEKQSSGKQVPWEASSLKGDFYFASAPAESAHAPTRPPMPATGGGARTTNESTPRTINEEEALWKVIEGSQNSVEFEEYLRAFPDGRFVPAARARLRQLRPAETSTPRTAEAEGNGVRPGTYRVQGTNPDGSPYRGTVTITRSGTLYQLRWQIGQDVFQGQGTLNGRVLTVDWGQPDPVIYQVQRDGTLEGTWAKGRATERLTPE